MTQEPASWSDQLRARLRQVRQERGLSFEKVSECTGIAKASLIAIEGGDSANVYLDHVAKLSTAYSVPLADLVCGWRGKRTPSRAFTVDDTQLHEHARASLRRDRGALGTPALAERAEVEQSTLVRWESGEYRRLDLIRLHRLAGALDVDLRGWITLA